MQRYFRLGGGVAPKTIRFRGQGLIEYVLIAAVIGLVVVFAGPQVSGAIRNQFSRVSTTLDRGADGGIGGGASGGSTEADSATVQAAIAKDAKDWTLEDQKAVAEDLAAKGGASPAYAKAKAAMDAGTKWSVKLTNGKTLEYHIIGIFHDDLADGSDCASLTFEATNDALGVQAMYTKDRYFQNWENSELRARLNSGDLWALLPSELQSKMKNVAKETRAKDRNEDDYLSVAADKVFLLSTTEIYDIPDNDEISMRFPEGYQYEYYQSKGVTMSNYSGASSSSFHWTRSVMQWNTTYFYFVNSNGSCGDRGHGGYPMYNIFPAWCF